MNWEWIHDPLTLTICIWATAANTLLATIINWRSWWLTNKRIKSLREEMSRVEVIVCEQAGSITGLQFDQQAFAEMKYRVDRMDVKTLRARNLGIGGLPQPREKKEDNP